MSTEATILSNTASSERIFIRLDLPSLLLCHSTFALRIRLNFIINSFRLRGTKALVGEANQNFMAPRHFRRWTISLTNAKVQTKFGSAKISPSFLHPQHEHHDKGKWTKVVICHQRCLEHTLFLLAHLSPKEHLYLINQFRHVVSVFTLDTPCW